MNASGATSVVAPWLGRLGPGLLFAATAVGVSHLVQSTRAGAEFGLTLLVLILFACAIKYPAFRFGAEYAALTGRTVLSGYERQGRWLLALILLATFIEGVGVVPAVTLVTVGLGMNLLGTQVDAIIATVATVFVASIVLLVGRYRVLENITRVFVALFAILTVLATVAAIAGINPGQPLAAPFEFNESNLAKGAGVPSEERLYQGFLWFQIVTSGFVLYMLPRSFGAFIDFITALGFLTGPVVAFMNHRIMFCGEIPPDRQPPKWIRCWSVAGTTILAVIFPIYLYFRLT